MATNCLIGRERDKTQGLLFCPWRYHTHQLSSVFISIMKALVITCLLMLACGSFLILKVPCQLKLC